MLLVVFGTGEVEEILFYPNFFTIYDVALSYIINNYKVTLFIIALSYSFKVFNVLVLIYFMPFDMREIQLR